MSLTDGLPHLFRKRTLMRRLELIGLDLDEEDAAILARQESINPELNEGSVLFGDEDEDFRTNRDVVLGQSGYSSLDQSLLNDSIDITRATSRRTLYPGEPGLPKEVKEYKWLRVFASCIVISSNGVQYSLSQFMPHTRDLGQKCMASAISLLICFFTLGCIFHGCYLMKHLSGPRICILLTSPLVFALLLSNTAIEVNAPWLMQVSFALTGLGIGPSYLSAIIHLQFWLPKRPGLASSIGMAFGGFGSVLMAMMIEICIDRYGVDFSFTALAITLFGLQVGGGLFLRMPDLSTSHTKDLLVSYRSKLDASARFSKSKDTDAFRAGLGIELRAGEILSSWHFALFWISAFTAVGPGYALFANMAMIFRTTLGMPSGVAATWVILVNLITTLIGRLPTGSIADRWNMSKQKLFGSGSRSMFLLFHCLQAGTLLTVAFVEDFDEYLSLLLIIILTCIFGGCNVLIAALSRELFAPINSSAVYGLILTSTASSALIFPNLMPWLARATGGDFVYNIVATVVSCVGLLCCTLLKPLPQAYGISSSLLEANS